VNETVRKDARAIKAPTLDTKTVEMTGVASLRPVGPVVRRRASSAAAVLIGIDVLMRKFLARSDRPGPTSLAGYSLAIGTAWGLGAALLDRAHIRIDSLYRAVPAETTPGARPPGAGPAGRLLRPDLLAWTGRSSLSRWISNSHSQSGAGNADRDPAGRFGSRVSRPSSLVGGAVCCFRPSGCDGGARSARRGTIDQHALPPRRKSRTRSAI